MKDSFPADSAPAPKLQSSSSDPHVPNVLLAVHPSLLVVAQ